MIPAVYDRRSVRKFLNKPIPQNDLIDIIQSGMKAPSSKNRQPWKYIVLQGNAKQEMIEVFRHGMEREEHENALLPQSRRHIAAAKNTADSMAEAPVVVFVMDTLGKSILAELTPEERISEICNIQSIGASIENMLLSATEKGIGSLWICDIYFAYSELCEWLGSGGQPIAAVAFGYPNEFPKERPRKKMEDAVEWRD